MKVIYIFLLCTTASILFKPSPIVCAESESATIYYYERMPFFGNLGKSDEGFINKITRLVFKDAGVPYHFEKTPVTRIFENLKASGSLCIAGGFKTPEREQLYSYSRYAIYQDGSPHYVIRKSDQKYFLPVTTIESLLRTEKVLGRVEKYSYGNWVDANINKYLPHQLTVNIGDDQNSFFRMLRIGRFDYLFSGEEEAAYNLRANDDYRNNLLVKTLSNAPEGNIRWIIFSRGFPAEWLAKINDSIVKIKNGSEYKNIVAQAKTRK